MWDSIKNLPFESVQSAYASLAVLGGVARYLNSFTDGMKPFKLSILLASAFVSGFSGYMFALLGTTLALPQPLLFVMAGTGGFFGEQTMKLVFEYFGKKVSPAAP